MLSAAALTVWHARLKLGLRLTFRLGLGLLVGCQSAAAPYTVERGMESATRNRVLLRQIAGDTTHALMHQPLSTARDNVEEIGAHLGGALHGGLGKRLLCLHGEAPPLVEHDEIVDLGQLDADLFALTGRELQAAEIALYIDGQQALQALLQRINAAQTHIDIIMFHWESDAVGTTVARHLLAAAQRGVRVRVLIDGGGNQLFGMPETASAAEVNEIVGERLQHANIQVIRIRNPFWRFDHRKLVLVDGSWAWTGGRNFNRSAFGDVHDLSFTLRGPLLAELTQRFEAHWRAQGGPAAERAPAPCSPACRANIHGRLLHGEPGQRELSQSLYRAVDAARHHIYLENPYLSDSTLVLKLAQARQRGVDVRVAISFDSGSSTIDRAQHVIANRLLAAGVRVFIHPRRIHVKALSIDGQWAYIGTGNFDSLSFRHNYELGLAIATPTLVQQLEEHLFLRDFQQATELHMPMPLRHGDYLLETIAAWWL